jgi:CMP/dCMP kinase
VRGADPVRRFGREPVVTIDGPAGAGKSTAARELARRLGFRLVQTGAMYRALAWAVREAGLRPEDTPALRALLARTTVEVVEGRMLVNGRDVSAEIRSPEIGELTSILTALRPVRDKMTPLQRALASAGGVVLEGRDTGSVVFPEAEVKIYLDASLESRARRRQQELRVLGIERNLDAVRAEVAQRDRQDMGREVAPLVRPGGAMVVDSTDLTAEAVIERLVEAVDQARCCTRS